MDTETIDVDEMLRQIAVDNLLLDDAGTLETRKSDSLDFHNNAVWCIKKALLEAFLLGTKLGLEEGHALGYSEAVGEALELEEEFDV